VMFSVTEGYQVWFNPCIATSDYLQLFSNPALWPSSRNKVNVFKVFEQSLLPGCGICGPAPGNNLTGYGDTHALALLKSWGKVLAVELGVIKPWDCSGWSPAAVSAVQLVANAKSLGGEVLLFDMDEPFLGGTQSCKLSLDLSAAWTAQFIGWVHANIADVVVGDIEPYPYFRVNELEQWIQTLNNLIHIPSFHVDLDFNLMEYLESRGLINGVDDMRRLKKFCNDRGIVFGVIVNAFPVSNDQQYGPLAVKHFEWFQRVLNILGENDHIIFESWNIDPPTPNNVPENQAYTHTWLINNLIP